MKLSSLISLPCAIGLSVLSYQILSLFFKADHVEKGAGMLSVLAPSVFFVCMLAITTSVLQAAGKEKLPIISMLAGSAVKLAGSFFLIPVLGKYGTPASTFLCYLTTVVINMYFVVKHTGVRPRVLEVYVKPLISGVLCGVSAAAVSYYTRNTLGLKLSTVLAILAAVIVYFGGILIFKSLEKEDFMLIPKGEKIYNLLNKLHMVK
jgi:stage V sporulation protein B